MVATTTPFQNIQSCLFLFVISCDAQDESFRFLSVVFRALPSYYVLELRVCRIVSSLTIQSEFKFIEYVHRLCSYPSHLTQIAFDTIQYYAEMP